MKLKAFFFFMLLLALPFAAFGQSAKSRTEPLVAGSIAPDFTLSDQNGKTIKLSKIKQTTVLVFYRGYW